MPGESPTHRKHDRSPSPEASEDRSKRRKHRHHRHRHHHRHHRSSRDKEKNMEIDEIQVGGERSEIGVEEFPSDNNIDGSGGSPSKDGALVSAFSGVNYEMEEGEIVDDEDLRKLKGNSQSDVESGEIEKARGCDDADMGDNEATVEAEGKMGSQHIDDEISGEVDRWRASISRSGLSNGSYAPKYREIEGRRLRGDGDDTKLDECDDAVDLRRASMSYDKKKQSAGSPSYPHERSKRSRSRSIAGEASYRGTPHKIDDSYYMESKHPKEFVDEGLVSKNENHGHGRRDRGGDRGRERSSSRHSDRRERSYDSDMRDGHTGDNRERKMDSDRERKREKYGREDRERDRERGRLQDWDRDRDRQRGEREREKDRRRDCGMDRDRDAYQERERRRGREKDWERGDEKRDRERGREGGRDGTRARRDWDREYENERLSRHIKSSNDKDDYRNRDISNRRQSEDDRREGSRKNDIKNGSSGTVEKESSIGTPEREIVQEDYEEAIVMQPEEQEEDELEKIKEESRRRRQAILEKYKNQQKSESKSQDIGENQCGEPPTEVPFPEGVKEEFENGLEGGDVDETQPSFSIGKSPTHDLSSQRPEGISGLGEGTPKSERSADMFHDDIFGESPAGVRKTGKGDGVAVEKSDFHDNWDDAEGYYGYRFGEVLDGRYEIIAAHGKGVFSTVVRAKDLKAKEGDPEEVAIKIIRNNETMYKAGMEELVILNKLVGADPENKRHCVRFLSTFKYRNHLCLVFESLHMNLREVLKKFGRNIGLKLTAVRAYAKQLFIALKHLKNCGVLHCDIKPDNMLVNEAKNVLKLCDFGNAMFTGKNEITPYLVSRFYRAPEIILGLPYDHPLDIWSVGCCLFELYTGKVLFPGHTNNDMLRLHMELKGSFPKKMLRKGGFTGHHFDQDLNFLAAEEDPVSKKVIRKLIINIKPKDFGTLISGYPGEDPKMVANFKDLMEKIFVLDPDKRITVSQALSHPFITGK